MERVLADAFYGAGNVDQLDRVFLERSGRNSLRFGDAHILKVAVITVKRVYYDVVAVDKLPTNRFRTLARTSHASGAQKAAIPLMAASKAP